MEFQNEAYLFRCCCSRVDDHDGFRRTRYHNDLRSHWLSATLLRYLNNNRYPRANRSTYPRRNREVPARLGRVLQAPADGARSIWRHPNDLCASRLRIWADILMASLQDRRIWFVTFRTKPMALGQLLDFEERSSKSFQQCELDSYLSSRTRSGAVALYSHHSHKAWHNRHRDIGLRWVREERLEDW